MQNAHGFLAHVMPYILSVTYYVVVSINVSKYYIRKIIQLIILYKAYFYMRHAYPLLT